MPAVASSPKHMRDEQDISNAIDRHGNAVWRVCVLHFKNTPDAEDAFQETFIKYSASEKSFESEEHCKAWLIRVAANQCKDALRTMKRHAVPIGGDRELSHAESKSATAMPDNPLAAESSCNSVIDAMQRLDDPPRTPVYLALYEGYSAPEISEILDAPVGTIYSWISRGKKLLREALK